MVFKMFVILQKYDFSSTKDVDTLVVEMFVILQKYDFSSKSQPDIRLTRENCDVCDTAKVRFFKQITTNRKAAPK